MLSISMQASKEMFGHVEKMIVATLVISAGAHVSSTDPAILLFGYLRHSFIGRGVKLFGIVLLFLNFLDGFYKLQARRRHKVCGHPLRRRISGQTIPPAAALGARPGRAPGLLL